jgi:hypothetical protein
VYFHTSAILGRKVFLDKLMAAQLVKKFRPFYETYPHTPHCKQLSFKLECQTTENNTALI